MKVFLKKDMGRVGEVLDVYTTDSGQKRMNVSFEEGAVEVDSDVADFEIKVFKGEIKNASIS